MFCEVNDGRLLHEFEAFLLQPVAYRRIFGRQTGQAIAGCAGDLPHHDIEDVPSQAVSFHEFLGDLIDGGVLDKPLAEVERCLDNAWLVNQHVDGHLLGGLDHLILHNSVFDEVFAIDDRFVDEPLVLDPVQEQEKKRVVCLGRLECLAEPALPLAMHLP